jgi:hypothetical protein
MSDTVTIGGREFRIGAWYQGKTPENASPYFKPLRRQLRSLKRCFRGRVRVAYTTKLGRTGETYARSWLEWAGDEVAP